ncbi:MAG: amidohydrolase family protein [Sedimentisphaerales bacterium]
MGMRIEQDIREVQAVDVHGHYGIYQGSKSRLLDEFMTGDAKTVVERARLSNTRLTIVSPLVGFLPRLNNDSVVGNEDAVRVVNEIEGLLQWVIIDPRKPQTYEQAREMLKSPKCVGIKIHPEEHGYPIAEQGRKIFEFAAEQNTVVLSHSGEKNSMPDDLVEFANEFPEVVLILAHLGCGWDDDPSHQVRAMQKSKHGNVYVDTSSAKNLFSGLIEWTVKEIGSERLLYGTDTPLYFAPMQRARIDSSCISYEAKKNILIDNAMKIFNF